MKLVSPPFRKRRRAVVVVALTIGIAAAFSIAFAFGSEHREFTQHQATAISVDIHRTSVITILKCPPGDYTSVETTVWSLDLRAELNYEWWISDTGAIAILFSNEDTVLDVQFYECQPVQTTNTWIERVRKRVGL